MLYAVGISTKNVITTFFRLVLDGDLRASKVKVWKHGLYQLKNFNYREFPVWWRNRYESIDWAAVVGKYEKIFCLSTPARKSVTWAENKVESLPNSKYTIAWLELRSNYV